MMTTQILNHPIDSLDLSAKTIIRLKRRGIITAEQLREHLARENETPTRISEEYAAVLKQLKKDSVASATPFTMPRLGVIHPNEAPRQIRAMHSRTKDLAALAAHVKSLDLPDQYMKLIEHNTPVRDQGRLGSCTGWASTSTRELSRGEILAPLFAYRLAKKLDGRPDLVGSWLAYACRGIRDYGHVLEEFLPYDDDAGLADIDHLLDRAAPRRAKEFVDLRLSNSESENHIPLFKAILSGRLVDELGPASIAISIAIYDSFDNPSVARTGLVTIPTLDGDRPEVLLGGHAIQLCGYTTLAGVDFWIFKNSWSEHWASENPLSLPSSDSNLKGYGLLPAAYLTDNRLLWEAFLFITAEESPVSSRWTRWFRPFFTDPIVAMPPV